MPTRRKTTQEEAPTMTEVHAEPYEEDADWDGAVEAVPADEDPADDVVTVPGRKGRKPLTLPAAAGRFERAKLAVAKLGALDVEAERARILARIERDNERLAKLEGHGAAVKDAAEELASAEAEFTDALSAVSSS